MLAGLRFGISTSFSWRSHVLEFTEIILKYLDIYHFSVGVQRRRSVFNSHIAREISWESDLPMTLIPSQFKESMRFDSLY